MKKIVAPKKHYQDMRDAFFEELFRIATKDGNVILLMADQGAHTLEKFKQKIPNQLINVGIAEQNMISVAAGLALCGKKVFVHAISNFTTIRCYEQIKVDLSIMELPVTIAGVGAGFTYGSDGPTHHANQDVAAMRAIPGMRILNASDSVSLSTLPHIAYSYPQLTYIRFDKGNVPALYDARHNFLDGLSEIKKGDDTVIVSTGIMVHHAVNIANNLGRIGVIDMYRLKPVPQKKLSTVLSRYKNIVVLEEHLAYGGLATIISDFLADTHMNKRFMRIGLPDAHSFVYGTREHMHEGVGLSYAQIIRKLKHEKF